MYYRLPPSLVPSHHHGDIANKHKDNDSDHHNENVPRNKSKISSRSSGSGILNSLPE
jgi:hypothetical protein